jgi:hypothetical protein
MRARLVGVVDGFAMITDGKQSRWLDVRAWPVKLLPLRDEAVRAVCPGATLTDRVYTWFAPGKKRVALPPIDAHAVGFLDGKPAVPGMMFDDGAWRALGGTAGPGTHHAIAGKLVVWGGRVLRYDRTLVETHAGDLPAGDTTVIAHEDGFVCAAGGKLVVVTREGKQREDRALGKRHVDTVTRYNDRWLVRAGNRYFLDDEPLDLGSTLPHPSAVFSAPCGLLGIVDKALVRFRV